MDELSRQKRFRRSGLLGLLRKLRFTASPPTANQVVVEAFEAFHSRGLEAALSLIERHGGATPPGTRALFQSMAAPDDAQWLAHFNCWLGHRGLARVRLTPGPGPRFHRMAFEPAEAMEAPCRVTVIVPCYNAQDMVESAIRSILAQTWSDLEVIAVDDASDDDTGRILKRLAGEDPRLVVLHNRVNVGPYVSRNRALRQATGDYVTGHDADDLAPPSRIADQMAPILAEAACRATLGHMIRLDSDGRLGYPTKFRSNSYDGIVRLAYVSLLVERKLLVEKLGYWHCVRFGADSEMIARVRDYLGPGLLTIDNVLMLCLSAPGSLTNDPVTGIGPMTGMSPVRLAYREAWTKWHGTKRPDQRFIAFPPDSSPFEAPAQMRVSEADILLVLGRERDAS